MTIATAAVLNPFFEVAPMPITVAGRELGNRVALVSEAGNTLGIVSKGYNVVTNRQVNDIFETAFADMPVAKITDHLNIDQSRWKRRIVLDKEKFQFEVLPGDFMGVMVELFNSYCGKNAWGFKLMGYRYICSNGQIMGKRSIFEKTFSHLYDAVNKVKNVFSFQLQSMEGVLDNWKNWPAIEFTQDDMGVFLVKQGVREKTQELLLNTYAERNRIEGLGENKWGAYNALTYAATHKIKALKGCDANFGASARIFTKLCENIYSYVPANKAA